MVEACLVSDDGDRLGQLVGIDDPRRRCAYQGVDQGCARVRVRQRIASVDASAPMLEEQSRRGAECARQ